MSNWGPSFSCISQFSIQMTSVKKNLFTIKQSTEEKTKIRNNI